MRRRVSVLAVFLLLFCSGYSQRKGDIDTTNIIQQPNRIEFEMDEYGSTFHVIPGESSGILVVQETENRSKEGFNWIFYSLDTTLTKTWTRILVIPYEYYMIGWEYSEGKYYVLYQVDRYRGEEMMLYEIDVETGNHLTYDISTVFPISLTFFEIIDSHAVFAGYTNYRPVLLTYDLGEQKPRVVPGFYDNKSDILDIVIDDEVGMFTVIQQERTDNRRNTISVKSFTSSGEIIQSNTINPGPRNNLVDGASTMFLNGYQYIAGTFSKNTSEYSRGLYLSKFVNGRQQFLRYHDYAELNKFFDYMGEKRVARIKERIARKRLKGKKATFNYKLLVHDMIQRGEEYILIAEAYYPRYSTYSNQLGYAPRMGYQRMNPNFMGYKYTHAVVVAFDRNGNIIWDNSFEIDDVESFALEDVVVVSNYGDKIVLMYMEENTIRSKVIKGDEILEGKSISPVRLAYDSDEVRNRDPEIEGLKWWYGRTMYAFGEQRIRNEDGVGGRVYRRVFYINKIQYHLEDIAN